MVSISVLVASFVLITVVGASSICYDGALKYSFESSLISASNASKIIKYRGEVSLLCTGIDSSEQNSHFLLWFDSLDTSITDAPVVEPVKVKKRRRKLPPNLVAVDDPENPKTKTLQQSSDESFRSDDEMNSTIDHWYPLPNGPVLFDRLENGTISRLVFNKFDEGNHKVVSIKRAIVFAFQTRFPEESGMSGKRLEVLPEYDELGYHFTTFAFDIQSSGAFEVTKKVSTADFIEMQQDQINGGMLEINTVESQKFQSDGTLRQYSGSVSVDLASATHPSQTFSIDEDVKAQVAVDAKTSLALVVRIPSNNPNIVKITRSAFGYDWSSPEVPSDVLAKKDDPLAYIANVLEKIEPTLYSKGIATILDEFVERPRDYSIRMKVFFYPP